MANRVFPGVAGSWKTVNAGDAKSVLKQRCQRTAATGSLLNSLFFDLWMINDDPSVAPDDDRAARPGVFQDRLTRRFFESFLEFAGVANLSCDFGVFEFFGSREPFPVPEATKRSSQTDNRPLSDLD